MIIDLDCIDNSEIKRIESYPATASTPAECTGTRSEGSGITW